MGHTDKFVRVGSIKGLVSLSDENKGGKEAKGLFEVFGVHRVEISLHLGAHRTGTTSIQKFFGANGAQLETAGLSYWGPKRTRAGLMHGIIKNPANLTDEDIRLGKRAIGRIRLERDRLAFEGKRKLIVSEENLLGTMAQNLNSKALYSQATARLARLAPSLNDTPLRVNLAVRSLDVYWASAIAFRIRAGMPVPGRDMINEIADQPRRWFHVVRDVAAAFPQAEILVWPFEGWSMNPKPMIEAILGETSDLDFQGFEKCNESLSGPALAELATDRNEADAAMWLASSGQDNRFMPFSAAQRQKMQKDYRADLDWLSAGMLERVTYLDPTEGTFGGAEMTRGSTPNELEKGRMVQTG